MTIAACLLAALFMCHLSTLGSSYRLPENVKPISYDVYLKPQLISPFGFQGNVKIQVEIVNETDTIVLHSNKLDIIDITVGLDGEDSNATYTHDEDLHFLNISNAVETPFLEGRNYTIQINFNGTLADDMYGFYKSSYYTTDQRLRWIAATQFQPTHARSVFPCFDEPQFKATFKISIDTPSGYHTLGNMPLQNDPSEDEEGWRLHEFQETEIMSTYLIAFVVSDFQNLTNGTEKYNFSAWARPEATNRAAYSQKVGPDLVNFYEEYTGIDYVLPKIDQVALPDFAAGAMENWGLITYRETGLLYYDGISTESNKKSIALVVAHELAHMWFGDLITLKWWEYTWLNEGFARYFQYLALASVEDSSWRLMDQFVVDQHQAIFATDALTSAQSLSSECNTPAEIQSKFGSISYSKGGSVLRMLSYILTPGTFQRGLQRYLEAHKYRNTVPEDLFAALEEVRSEDGQGNLTVQEFFTNWTTQPGFPVINVTRNQNITTLTQERFLLKHDEEQQEVLSWTVPLTWTTNSQGIGGFNRTQPMGWLMPGEVKVIQVEASSDEWIIFNNQEAGYYRVNYDPEAWRLITQSLQSKEALAKIHVLNRAQLVDDALNLARAGYLDYNLALDLADYLTNEQDYIPWASAFSAFSFLDRRLTGQDGHDNFKRYIRHLIDNLYNDLGFEEVEKDQHTTKLLRVNVLSWACRFDHDKCITKAKEMFHQYYMNSSKVIPANLQSVVYCTALRNGGDWEFLWQKYNESRIAAEKVTILSALGCTGNETLLKEYLEKSVDPESGIRKQDAASVFSSVYSNPKGVNICFEFLSNNYTLIAESYGGMNAISNILTGIAGRLTTEDEVQKLEDFITKNEANLGSAVQAGKNAVEAARADLAWTAKHREVIVNWLKAKIASLTGSAVTITSISAILLYIIACLPTML